jgi:hypothetical protein
LAQIDHENKSAHATICYVGCSGSGKLANLSHIDQAANPGGSRLVVGQWVDHARTMSHTTVHLETEHGYHVELSLHGLHQMPDEHPALVEADAIVVVVDCRASMLQKNAEAITWLRPFLERTRVVVQYNRRDDPTALDVEELAKKLDLAAFPSSDAVAREGSGVLETLKLAVRQVFS